jgi:16S rRNA C967 or C1407 C5-methylase (RsmB/RsmF family)
MRASISVLLKKMGKTLSNAEVKRRAKAAAAEEAAEKLYFLHHQKETYGARMSAILAAMKKDNPPGALINRYCDPGTTSAYLEANAPAERAPGLDLECYLKKAPADDAVEPARGAGAPTVSKKAHLFTPAKADMFGILSVYHMDAASLLAVQAADLKPDDKVLDMCSAPGGKALAACQLLGPHGSVVANDVSNDRRKRLADTFSFYLPKRGKKLTAAVVSGEADDDVVTPSSKAGASATAGAGLSGSSSWEPPVPPTVTVVGHDGTVSGAFGSDCFDKVMLDAPCTSDRHLLHDPEELAKWGPGRIKGNAARQCALLAVALDACKPGGTVIYSTCALSPKENDGVVEKVLPEMPFPVTIIPLKFAFGEPTPLGGWHVLPDTANGFGVLYICKLIKGKLSKATAATVRGDYSDAGPTRVTPAVPEAAAVSAVEEALAKASLASDHGSVDSSAGGAKDKEGEKP